MTDRNWMEHEEHELAARHDRWDGWGDPEAAFDDFPQEYYDDHPPQAPVCGVEGGEETVLDFGSEIPF